MPSDILTGVACYLLGEDESKKIARTLGGVSGEFKEAKRDLNPVKGDEVISPDLKGIAEGLGIDVEDKDDFDVENFVKSEIGPPPDFVHTFPGEYGSEKDEKNQEILGKDVRPPGYEHDEDKDDGEEVDEEENKEEEVSEE
ncbi:hypothetical protein C9439_00860 [archaeon SCG-AAA382B04]|nr:hypothetical protein C9439_00860 [archaeon SCG-AAA382B04]